MNTTKVELLKRVHAELQSYKDNSNAMAAEHRFMFSGMLSTIFSEFEDFAELGMRFLGFSLTPIQRDICNYMQYGGSKIMVQAQRGQAKSTLAALYCIWRLISTPSLRILIVSGGGTLADNMAILLKRIIMSWSILCWMRPDISKGDRDSAVKFDVHHAVKGIDKSASITSKGITASLTGERADLILADDVETPQNSLTQPMRESLSSRTTEFAAICIRGGILYLGTPQSKDSVYKNLPVRGYSVRVWTGRYPTVEELERYGNGVEIAPCIMEAMKVDPSLQTGGGIDGTRGKPTDPECITEEMHQEKELEYGAEGYALQYMLDTTLSDERRTKIKLQDFIVYGGNTNHAPESIYHSSDPSKQILDLAKINAAIGTYKLYYAASASGEMIDYSHKLLTVDPAGNGGDEIAYASGGATKGFIHIFSMGGLTGGFTTANINKLLAKCATQGIKAMLIERNTGAGAVTALIRNQIERLSLLCRNKDQSEEMLQLISDTGMNHIELLTAIKAIGIEDFFSTVQKEKRIIDTISPVTRRNKIVLHMSAIEEDWQSCLQYTPASRFVYSGLYQLANITYDRGSLIHDDRADVIQSLIQALVGFLANDDAKAAQQRSEQEFRDWLNDPMGYKKAGYKAQSITSNDRGVSINLNKQHSTTSRRGTTIRLGSNRIR